MRKYSLLVGMALSMAACNGNAGSSDKAKDAPKEEAQATVAKTTTPKIKDPSCGMEMDGEHWTEFVVTGTDTAWFCSPVCKEKYQKSHSNTTPTPKS
jgi:hypothetical protein